MANPTVTIEIKEIGADKVIAKMKAVRGEAGKLAATKKRIASAGKEEKVQMGQLATAMSRVVRSNKLASSSLDQVGARMQSITGNTKLAASGMSKLGMQMNRVTSSNKLAGKSFVDLGQRMQIMMRSNRLAESQSARLAAQTTRQVAAQAKLARSTRNLRGATAAGTIGVSRFAEAMRNLETSTVLAIGPLSGLGARVRAISVLFTRSAFAFAAFFAGITGGVVAFAALTIGMFKTRRILEAVESRFIAVTGSILLTRVAMDDALTVSRKFGLSFEAASDGLSRLAAAARGTSLEGEKIRKVFEGISAAVGSMRLGVIQAQGIFRAFEQILTKGVVRAEEVNQQLGDVLPGAAKILASAVGVTTSRLQEMLRTGELLAEETLPKIADKMVELFGPQAAAGAESVQGALNSVGTELLIFFDVIETRFPIIAFFVEGLNDMAIALGNISEGFKTPTKEAERFFEALARDRPRFETVGLLEAERKRLIGAIREIQAQLLQEIEPVRLQIARLEVREEERLFKAPGARGALVGAQREFDDLIGLFNKLNNAVKELQGFTERKLPKIQDIIDAKELERLTRRFEDLKRETGLASDNLNALVTGDVGLIRINNATAKVDKTMSRFTDKTLVTFAKKMKFETVEALREAFIAMELAGRGFVELGKILESTRTPLEKYNLEIARLVALAKEFPGFSDIITKQMNLVRRSMIEADEGAQLLSSGMDSLASGIVKAMTTAGDAMETFRALAKDIVDDILESFLQLSVTNPLKNLVFGLEEGTVGAFKTLGDVGGGFLGELFGESEKAAESLKGLSESSVESSGVLSQQLVQAAIQAAISTGTQSAATAASTSAITLMAIAAEAAAAALEALAVSAGAQGGGGILGGLFGGASGLFGGGGAAAGGGATGAAGIGFGVFAHGGSFTVPGSGGTDSTLVKFRATPGEKVTIRTPAQQGGGMTVNIDARGADKAAIARLERAFLNMNATFNRRAVGAVSESRRRGGNIAKALRG